jgi:hypothetical protein
VTDRSEDETLGARLLAEDERRHRGSAAPPARDPRALLELLVDHEIEMERRVRIVAFWAWCAVVAFVCLTGLMWYLRGIDREILAEAAGPGMYVFATLMCLALFLALLMTIVWLVRTRGMSLAVLERRLASLEAVLRRER